MEFSVGSLVAGEAVPFKHKHKQNEEVYVFLSGKGIFSLDGEEFPVASGSVVRVAPSVVRTHRNTGDVPLVFLCFQAKAGSLEQATLDDGQLMFVSFSINKVNSINNRKSPEGKREATFRGIYVSV